MRYIGLVVLISCGLAACQSHQSVEQQPAKVVSTLDPIDFKKKIRWFMKSLNNIKLHHSLPDLGSIKSRGNTLSWLSLRILKLR